MSRSTHPSTAAAAATTAKPEPGRGFRERPAAVLQVLPALGAEGGVERGTIEIAGAVVAAGGRALVASAGGPREEDVRGAGGIHFALPLASKNPVVLVANAGRLAALIRSEGVAIVHARSRAPAWSAWLASRHADVAFVTTFHGTYGARPAAKRWYNAVMTRGERVIAISRFIAEHLQRVYRVPAERLRVIPRGVDLAEFDPDAVSPARISALSRQWRHADRLPVITLPGRLTRWKGQLVFVEAIARLGRRDVRALLIGSDQGRTGYRRELEDLIRRHDLGDVVHIVDRCDDMPAAYLLSDVVVSASTEPEAFGRIAVEAQAMGRPVIGTDHGGSRETIIPGTTGWLTAPGEAGALAAALDEALRLPEEAHRRMAEAAIANVRRTFTKELMCARTLDVYDEVLRRRRGG